jgi:hypothetical protein
MAELDYAYLAEYAQVIDGKLTAVNASFIDVKTTVPAVFQFAVAGRVRAPADANDVIVVAIKLEPPRPEDGSIVWTLNLSTKGLPVHDDKAGVLFAVRAAIPISAHGLCVVGIDVDNQEARRLAFEARPL